MKKILLSLTALLIIASACNKIDTSKEIFTIMGPVEITSWDPEYAKTVIQKIYLEEFTGHRCTYCPDGAREIKAIMDEDPTIIATAIHCTNLADPLSQVPFNVNYKTPLGDVICSDFNISGLPKAMINRIESGANKWGFDRNDWRKEISKIDRNNLRAGIEMQCSVNESIKEIEARISVTIIKEIKNPVQICLLLQQDGVVSGQIDNGTHILDYIHNHMLRAGFNGNYGTALTPNGLVKEQFTYSTTFKLSYANSFPYSSIPVEIENCSVVAYLLDKETKEVIQVEKVDVNN
jgi:hypothetical protein